jgi:hypothetical protein
VRRFFGNFALVFLVGFFVAAAAVGIGSVNGQIFSSDPLLKALRSLGEGLMIAAFAMWIALLRDQDGKAGLGPFFMLLIVAGMIVLLIGVIDPYTALASALGWGGLGAETAALVLGVVSMWISPAYPTPPTSHWPEGGEQDPSHSGSGTH